MLGRRPFPLIEPVTRNDWFRMLKSLNDDLDDIMRGVNGVTDSGVAGVILLSPDGSSWKVTVGNTGTLSTTKL
jgi:hypothetical protein